MKRLNFCIKFDDEYSDGMKYINPLLFCFLLIPDQKDTI